MELKNELKVGDTVKVKNKDLDEFQLPHIFQTGKVWNVVDHECVFVKFDCGKRICFMNYKLSLK